MNARLPALVSPIRWTTVEEERGAVGRLARRAADHHRLGAEDSVVLDEVGQHEARHEQRPVQDLEVLEVRVVGRVAGRGGEPVVRRGRCWRCGLASRNPFGPTPVGSTTRWLLVGQVPEVAACPPPPRARCCAPPRRSPRAARGRRRFRPAPRREEVPVLHRVAEHRVGHVVGGHPDPVDPQHHLPVGRVRAARRVDELGVGEVGTIDEQVPGHGERSTRISGLNLGAANPRRRAVPVRARR